MKLEEMDEYIAVFMEKLLRKEFGEASLMSEPAYEVEAQSHGSMLPILDEIHILPNHLENPFFFLSGVKAHRGSYIASRWEKMS